MKLPEKRHANRDGHTCCVNEVDGDRRTRAIGAVDLEEKRGLYAGRDRAGGALKWTATPVDLVFGSDSELRAVSEVYASADGRDEFVRDFAKAWVSVMNRDLQ